MSDFLSEYYVNVKYTEVWGLNFITCKSAVKLNLVMEGENTSRMEYKFIVLRFQLGNNCKISVKKLH